MEANIERLEELIAKFTNEILILSDYNDKKQFDKLFEEYYGYIKEGFENEETQFRKTPILFRFNPPGEPNSEAHMLELRHFITNLLFWQPIVNLGYFEELAERHIVDCTQLSSRLIEDYVNELIILPYRNDVGNRKLNRTIHDMIFNLSRISTDFNQILGLSMNVETFIDLANESEEFDQILRTDIPDSMQPSDVEKTIDESLKRMITIMKEKDNMLRPFLRVGSGVKSKQLAEFAINGGLKPDLDGATIPKPINSNLIVGGYNSVSGHFIDANGGRKAQIMNSSVMGDSGHFARMIMMISSGEQLDATLEDCGTVHPIDLEIKTKEHLKRLQGRYYRLPQQMQYKLMTGKETELIGQKILLRSPVTCASKKICKKCYGQLTLTNEDLNSVGGFAGAKITEPLSQMILSSKHMLNTDSERLSFNEPFDDLFLISANEILVNLENEDKLSDFALVIDFNEVQKIHEFDESEYNMFVQSFDVLHIPTKETFTFKEKNRNQLYLHQSLLEKYEEILEQELRESKGKRKAKKPAPKKGKTKGGEPKVSFTRVRGNKLYITLDDFTNEDVLFVSAIMNNELTRPLNDIRDLLRLKDHGGLMNDFVAINQELLDLLIESEIPSVALHGEVILRPLVRRSNNVQKRPHFRRYDAISPGNVTVLTILSALEYHPSVEVSLSFQYLKRQLSNPSTYEKDEGSFIDSFFRHNAD